MEEMSDTVPLSPHLCTVGIIYNSKTGHAGNTPDAEAEFDNPDTVFAIRDALISGGFRVVLMEGDKTLPESLSKTHIDIAFNIAEGLRGRGREAEVPAVLNVFGIPFTGSDETALCIALDKALCKNLLSSYGVRAPRHAVIAAEADAEASALSYPVIVKPNAEGSSKGVSEACVVRSKEELCRLCRENLRLYGEPMLAEEYIDGREFTVGILGNGKDVRVFPPMEIVFRGHTQGDFCVYSYGVKQDYKKYVDYRCPAALTPEQEKEMKEMALAAFRALGCHDFTRVDFRMDAAGNSYFIEMNPLPGLAPGYSDFPMLAEFCGTSYRELVLSVLHAALKRLGMEEEQE